MTAWGTSLPITVSELSRRLRYRTDITVGRNGQESRNALWQDPLYAYNLAYNIKSYSDIKNLETLFHAVRGREQSFILKDYGDYNVTTFTTFAETPNGVRTAFQLIKKYVEPVIGTYNRTITKPGTATVTIRDNGVTVSAANYAVSTTTGIVTFSVAPVTGHTIDFTISEFYVPVRFDIDELPMDMLTYWIGSSDVSNVQIPDIPVVEVRGE
jgi:uncharacterized protein (TIGR02217 family)